ncbi:MAG: DUF5665 domain-containing protein [bacterium]
MNEEKENGGINSEEPEEKKNAGVTQNGPDFAKEIVTELKKFFTFDILNYIRKPWKLIGLNFFMGLVRGIGFFLGMTIIGAIVFTVLLSVLHKITQSNIPVISEWLARIVAMVQENLKMLK